MVNSSLSSYYLNLKDCERDFRLESFVAAGQRYFQVSWKTVFDGVHSEQYVMFSSLSSALDFVRHNLDL